MYWHKWREGGYKIHTQFKNANKTKADLNALLTVYVIPEVTIRIPSLFPIVLETNSAEIWTSSPKHSVLLDENK